MNFFSPAINLLNRLKYSKKFIFFGSVVMSIVIFLSVLLYQQLNQVIVDSKIQREGVEKVVAVNNLIKLFQEYRGLSTATSVFPYYLYTGTNRAIRSDIRSVRDFPVIIAF